MLVCLCVIMCFGSCCFEGCVFDGCVVCCGVEIVGCVWIGLL